VDGSLSGPGPGGAGRQLPLLYFGLAHLCLVCAFAVVALVPMAVAGFYYHPRALAVVHLVTLGWITASSLGALYMIVPMALGGRLTVGRADGWVLAVYAIGATGIASHFWLEEPVGMVSSAGMAAGAAFWVSGRAARAVRATRIPAEVKAHFYLAFANLLLAASLGVAVGFDKLRDLLPGASLDHVVSHAHLAALGWATMTVMAAGYRLLPMILPAAPPTGAWVWAGAILMQTGVLGLSLSLYFATGPVALGATLCAAGVAVFISRVVWMVRRRRPPPAALRRPEIGQFHVAGALLWLVVAMLLGLAIVFEPAAPWRQRAILVYAVAGLVGFLSQIVVGVGARIVPLWIWLAELGGKLHERRPPSPYALADRRLQLLILVLWATGVPLLAAGLGLDRHAVIRSGATLLAIAAAGGLWQLILVWRTARQAGWELEARGG
jgi:hypothetical protein